MYNKLFTKILDSSIWLESVSTRIVWMTMIAAMDETGYVQFASAANLAHRARVSPDEGVAAIECLESPDPNSSDPDNDGRRIERVPGGWIVLNAVKYREMVTRSIIQEQTRARVAKHRASKISDVTQCNAKKRSVTVCNAHVTQCNATVTPSEADTHSEAKAEATPKAPTEISVPAEAEPPSAPPAAGHGQDGNLPTSDQAKFIANLFNRRLTTAWTEKERKAFRKIGVIEMDDLFLIGRYYAAERARGDEGCHRRDLSTFLNNFQGELDRARLHAEKPLDRRNPHAGEYQENIPMKLL
jgi:hypothetical protein